MFSYSSEAAFSKALCGSLTKRGIFHQRIETGETGRGVPDIYAIVPLLGPVWIELKRSKTVCPETGMVKVAWRPGQQGWMIKQWKAGGIVCITLVCFNNCILRIPMGEKLFKDNMVPVEGLRRYWRLSDVL